MNRTSVVSAHGAQSLRQMFFVGTKLTQFSRPLPILKVATRRADEIIPLFRIVLTHAADVAQVIRQGSAARRARQLRRCCGRRVRWLPQMGLDSLSSSRSCRSSAAILRTVAEMPSDSEVSRTWRGCRCRDFQPSDGPTGLGQSIHIVAAPGRTAKRNCPSKPRRFNVESRREVSADR
jgi:hypothetical protein